jgi:hypothetical protein
VIEVAEQTAAGHMSDARTCVDLHAAQERQIQKHAAFAGRLAGRAVAAAFHGDEQIRGACELNRVSHVRRSARLDDERGALVHLRVPDAASWVVGGVARQQQIAAQALAQLLNFRSLQRDTSAIARDRLEIPIDRRR